MDAKTTRQYILSLTLDELRPMHELYSKVLMGKIIQPRITGFTEEQPPVWFYIGEKHDHIIVPHTYCSCRDFLIRVMSKKQSLACRHLLMQRIAELKGKYRVVEMNREEYLRIVYEIVRINISPTLRKLLYISRRKT